jgi:hypothetical protein
VPAPRCAAPRAENIERAVALAPVSSALRGEAGWVFLSVGRASEALAWCDRALAIDQQNVHARQCAMYASEQLGDRRRTLVEAGAVLAIRLPDGTSAPASLDDYHRRYLATLGERQRALAELSRVIADRVPHLMIRLGDPRLAALRDAPEFQQWRARLLPDGL